MKTSLLAVPSNLPGGSDASIAPHFGHCAIFSLFAIADGRVGETRVLVNAGHDSCLTTVGRLAAEGVTAIAAPGMGARPLAGFRDAGIVPLLTGDCRRAGEAAAAFVSGRLEPFPIDGGCASHADAHNHHHDGEGCGCDG